MGRVTLYYIHRVLEESVLLLSGYLVNNVKHGWKRYILPTSLEEVMKDRIL